ncbi:MAG: hypothetical protein GKR99_02930 [Rhodobacteraceae bacterium]|nr:hypothetical protein [Paracoccaceae bacterium]
MTLIFCGKVVELDKRLRDRTNCDARIINAFDRMRIHLPAKSQLARSIPDRRNDILGGVDRVPRVVAHPPPDRATDGRKDQQNNWHLKLLLVLIMNLFSGLGFKLH